MSDKNIELFHDIQIFWDVPVYAYKRNSVPYLHIDS